MPKLRITNCTAHVAGPLVSITATSIDPDAYSSNSKEHLATLRLGFQEMRTRCKPSDQWRRFVLSATRLRVTAVTSESARHAASPREPSSDRWLVFCTVWPSDLRPVKRSCAPSGSIPSSGSFRDNRKQYSCLLTGTSSSFDAVNLLREISKASALREHRFRSQRDQVFQSMCDARERSSPAPCASWLSAVAWVVAA